MADNHSISSMIPGTSLPEKSEPTVTPLDIPSDLLKKYHRSGPRYTSYPTAPQFKTHFDRETVRRMWMDTNTLLNPLSIYTHFPFCPSRCLYCGCHTIISHTPELRETYLQTLEKEAFALFKIINPSRSIHQLALGGGTPLTMSIRQVIRYIRHLENLSPFSPQAERSIEIDPRHVDEEALHMLIETGFNRFSFGVQDLSDHVQKIIHRVLDLQKLENLVSFSRKQGIKSINLDLIYGLPGQTRTSFSETIEKIIDIRPSRIALFGYAHVPWVSPHQQALDQFTIPNPEERMILFGTAFQQLLNAGYRHVGMDHFALPQDELLNALDNRTLTRNFMGYTTRRGLDLIGIGASAISSVGQTYTQNEKDVNTYISDSGASAIGFVGKNYTYTQNEKDVNAYISDSVLPPWKKGLILTPEDTIRRQLILDLFCNFHLDITAFEKRYEIDFTQHFQTELRHLIPMEQDGLIRINSGELIVTRMGRFFIRNICMVFDQYLTKETENPDHRYSKTI